MVLGGDGVNHHSEAKTQFAHKESGYQSVDKNRVLDFKAAHFQVGFPEGEVENKTEAQAHYHAKPLTKVEVEGKKPTNVELKHDDKLYFQSSYGDHFQEVPVQKTEILNKDGRKDNVVIGMGNEKYNSEAKDEFGYKKVDVVRGKGHEAEIDLGDGTRQFGTQYNNTYDNKHGKIEQKKVGKEDITKMRVENFVTGFEGRVEFMKDLITSCIRWGTGREGARATS